MDDDDTASRWASRRGKFEIFRAPELRPQRVMGEPTDAELEAVVDKFDITALTANHPEPEVRSALVDMFRNYAGGSAVSLLFGQFVSGGMSLGHAWFGPNLPLYRHSHPRLGDCLYYVLAGEVILGKRVLRAGDGFFVPNEMSYKFTAGADGVEILEFRSGGGRKGAPVDKIDESSLDAIRRIAAACAEQQPGWRSPLHVASQGLASRTLDP